MSIDERIASHEIAIRKLNDEKDDLENKLNTINEKLIYHNLAVINLDKKKQRRKAMRTEADIRARFNTLMERSRALERMNDLYMALDLIHRADELRWALGELDDNYNEITGEIKC